MYVLDHYISAENSSVYLTVACFWMLSDMDSVRVVCGELEHGVNQLGIII